jgi:sulfur-oxidizing protein SoxZ
MTCDWGRAVSKNPYLSFAFSGAKAGDTLRISWQDSSGNKESKESVIQ